MLKWTPAYLSWWFAPGFSFIYFSANYLYLTAALWLYYNLR